MNSNEEKNTGKNGLIIVYKSSIFHQVRQTGTETQDGQ